MASNLFGTPPFLELKTSNYIPPPFSPSRKHIRQAPPNSSSLTVACRRPPKFVNLNAYPPPPFLPSKINCSWKPHFRSPLLKGVDGPPRPGEVKLLISNLHYEVGLDLLASEFGSCGAVMRCRIINGVDGRSRGIAFVSYGEKSSADRAISKYHDRCVARRSCLQENVFAASAPELSIRR